MTSVGASFDLCDARAKRLNADWMQLSDQEMVDQIQDLEAAPDDTLKKQKKQQFSVNYSQTPAQDTETLVNMLSTFSIFNDNCLIHELIPGSCCNSMMKNNSALFFVISVLF